MVEKIKIVLNMWHEHFENEEHHYSEFEKSDIEYFVACLLYNHFAFSKALDTYIADHPQTQMLNPEEKKEFFDLILFDGKTEKSIQSLQEIMGKLDPTFLDKDNLIGYNSLSALIQITNDLINLLLKSILS